MTGIRDDKVVAGLRCGEVLAMLSDYLDGDLAPEGRLRIEEHLRGCDGCARFGGELRDTIRALRTHLTHGSGLPGRLRVRLQQALDEER
jgi:anti-sigma factor RsiW